MKILAIRGKNLASLAGEFAVELDQAPLAEAGLFAIVGPTGAGKSTLLDAMCLALFDRTPRLSGRKVGVFVGTANEPEDARLGALDVRSILRKGTAVGYAEVDFTGQDGRRHRARWSVRRARDRSDGNFQPQTMTLEHVDTREKVGGTKTEILEAIEKLVGLSFDQFKRSALLAQGEFAAFLQAKGAERAELLEKMTGTEIYQRISVLAFERAKDEKDRLDQLEAELAGSPTLDDAQRAALAVDLTKALEAAVAATTHLQALKDAREWFERRAKLVAVVQDAEAEVLKADATWDTAGPERERLTQVEGVQFARGPIAAADVAELDARTARHALEAATASERTRSVEDATALRALEDASAQFSLRESEEKALQPAITEAMRIDTEIDAARRHVEDAEKHERERTVEAEKARDEANISDNELATAEAALFDVAKALEPRTKYDLLADEWSRWKSALQQCRSAAETLETIDLPTFAEAERKAKAVHTERMASSDAAEGLLAKAQAEVTGAEDALTALDADALRDERDVLETRKNALDKLRTSLSEVQRSAHELADAKERHAKARATADTADEAAKEAERDGELATSKLDAAKAKLETAQAVRDLDGYRAQLQEHKECPLCGSKEHPFGRRAPKVDKRIETAQEEVKALEKEVNKLQRVATSQGTKRDRALEEAVEHASTAKQRDAEHQKSRKAYGVQHKACAETAILADPMAKETEHAITVCVNDVDQRLTQTIDSEAKAKRLESAAKKARQGRDARQGEFDAARKACEVAKTNLAAATGLRADAEAKRNTAMVVYERAIEEVSPAFDKIPEWRDAFRRNPKAFDKSCAAEVAEQSRLRKARAEAKATIDGVRPQQIEAKARLAERMKAVVIAQGMTIDSKEKVGALVTTRKGLLGGRATKAVVLEVGEAVKTARNFEREVEAVRVMAAQKLVEAKTLSDAAEATVRETETREAARRRALEEVLDGRDVEQCRALLVHDQAWIDSRRAHATALQTARERAVTIREERREQRELHVAAGIPSVAEEAVEASLAESKVTVDAAETARTALALRVHDDDQARAQRGTKAAEIQEQKRLTDFWQEMKGLIGSSDGKRFRVFAQSLFFGALLEQANYRLSELSRRYSLAPAAQGDLEFQIVDHDMAEEVRPSSTLSGGESFLVSLALALGLSAFGAGRTRVDSLFIDEGFGTLDTRSLDAAIASLEQASSGRQVGVVSHIEKFAMKLGASIHVKRTGMRSTVSVERG